MLTASSAENNVQREGVASRKKKEKIDPNPMPTGGGVRAWGRGRAQEEGEDC
jgi:hypothetical protein